MASLIFLHLRTVFLLLFPMCLFGTRHTTSPHIIYILADDLGWNDVSFHGSPQIPTPNIDALASSGVVLHNFYMAPQCTPSRASLMTGRYTINTGLQHFVIIGGQPHALPLHFKILPQHLKDLGYVTSLVGKWHLGYFKKEYTPLYRGFDSFYGYFNGVIDYYDYTYFYTNGNLTFHGIDLYDGEKPVKNFRGRYATDVFTDKAVTTIQEHNTSKPLFLLMSHAAPHTGNRYAPFQAPPEAVAKFPYIKDMNRRNHAGNVAKLDESVGQIFQALESKGMLSNSIIIFSSDNGGATVDFRGGASSNWPLRGQKMQLWEGGVRVPALVWSPLLGLKQPRTSNQLMHVSDWLPTLYSAAGGDVRNLQEVDGLDLWSHIMLNLPSPREEIILNIDPIYDMAAIRAGDYKLIRGRFPEKDDIWSDPPERNEVKLNGTLDEWVWKGGSIVKDILEKNGWWLVRTPDLWRQNLSVRCEEHVDGLNASCDPTSAPCLFNLGEDPCEYHNLADVYPQFTLELNERIDGYEAMAAPAMAHPLDPKADPLCHGFTFVPWRDVEHASDCPYA